MTHPKYPTKTRGEIAATLAQHLQADGDVVHRLRGSLTAASTSLHMQRFDEDRQWLRAHRRQIDDQDPRALQALGRRLIQRLTIEGESLADTTSRAIDSLTVDTARHLATSGSRADIVACLFDYDRHQLSVLLADTLVRLAGYDALIDELYQLRAQVNIDEAKAEQAAAEAVQA